MDTSFNSPSGTKVTDGDQDVAPRTVQVIIIGAGLGGLQAAHDLQQAGIMCKVLEARGRVGGKLWSVSVPTCQGQGAIELGGAWVNDRNQPHVMELVRRFGLEMIEQNTTGNCILEGHGAFPYGGVPELGEEDKASFTRIKNGMEERCHAIDILRPDKSLPVYGQMSVDDLALSMNTSEVVRSLVNIWTAAMLGKQSTDVSALYFLHYCRAGGGFAQMRSDSPGGGQHLRFRAGSQGLCTGLAACLKKDTIVYSAPVAGIEQTLREGCTVTTRDGKQYHSDVVISTIPTPLLTQVTFSPPLSADKRWLATNGTLGFYAKVFLVYSAPWWRMYGLCGLSQGLSGPVSLTRDTSSDKDGVFALACFVVGNSGRAWAEKPAEERLQDVISHIDRIYGPLCSVPRPLYTKEQIWNSEEFSMGAPCSVVPAHCLPSLSHDKWRPEGRLYFAGTETSTVWKGYMEGALASGSRVAKEVASRLKPDGWALYAKL